MAPLSLSGIATTPTAVKTKVKTAKGFLCWVLSKKATFEPVRRMQPREKTQTVFDVIETLNP